MYSQLTRVISLLLQHKRVVSIVLSVFAYWRIGSGWCSYALHIIDAFLIVLNVCGYGIYILKLLDDYCYENDYDVARTINVLQLLSVLTYVSVVYYYSDLLLYGWQELYLTSALSFASGIAIALTCIWAIIVLISIRKSQQLYINPLECCVLLAYSILNLTYLENHSSTLFYIIAVIRIVNAYFAVGMIAHLQQVEPVSLAFDWSTDAPDDLSTADTEDLYSAFKMYLIKIMMWFYTLGNVVLLLAQLTLSQKPWLSSIFLNGDYQSTPIVLNMVIVSLLYVFNAYYADEESVEMYLYNS
ncbi:hypothetical protein MP228_007318 [Amoeboaphelidium protococcarum]|nr:hypothetical protein MP228_007318 [Amoeboaphelidium protococcarum]